MFSSALLGSIVASIPERKLVGFDYYYNPIYETTYPNAWMWFMVLGIDIYSIVDAVIVVDKINKGKFGLEFKPKKDGVQLALDYKF